MHLQPAPAACWAVAADWASVAAVRPPPAVPLMPRREAGPLAQSVEPRAGCLPLEQRLQAHRRQGLKHTMARGHGRSMRDMQGPAEFTSQAH